MADLLMIGLGVDTDAYDERALGSLQQTKDRIGPFIGRMAATLAKCFCCA